MSKIKICGLFRECDAEYVNEAMPDFAGFVFAKSKRQVGEAMALHLREIINPAISCVGVFVNAPVETVITSYSIHYTKLYEVYFTYRSNFICVRYIQLQPDILELEIELEA